jgi:S-formylglutathione hydrolase FrmB
VLKARVFVALLVAAGVASGCAASGSRNVVRVPLHSAALSAFWHRPIATYATVLLPNSYARERTRRYPVMYWIQGFGGDGSVTPGGAAHWQRSMQRAGKEFIVVFLSGMFHGGHDVFADSANNGPWGHAFTTEFVPQIDARFRTLRTPASRFVAGHSSGAWAALWLQITYPGLFNGAWAVSPDPVDFRDFVGPNLTLQPPQNFFHDKSGHAYMLAGRPLRAFANGPGWESAQFDSFDAVFSPRGPNGKPEQLFNRSSGAIDPAVERYWDAHYDIAAILKSRWHTLGPKLRGKLHVLVGTADQFDLAQPVRLLQQTLRTLGSDAEFDYDAGATHSSVMRWQGDAITAILREAAVR